MRIYNLVICVICFSAVVQVFYSCGTCSERNDLTLRIIHAGSLSVPVREAADLFETMYPGMRILTEAWGSKAGARRVSELEVPCDIFISADYRVIDVFLIPDHALWNISFAGNEMAIVYNSGSLYADQINSMNWYDVLLRDDVIYGRSDPDSDPCGVRAVMVSQLAGIYYDDPELPAKLLSRHLNMIRPKETDLLALLEKNALDYIFLYRSVAEQHGLEYVELPDELNLKNPELNEWYAQAKTEVRGIRPGEKITETGEAMVYGITIPRKTGNQELAEAFVKFFLSADGGQKIMVRNGQTAIVPAVSSTFDHIPEGLRAYALKED